jgi:hypothetical protein
MVKGYCNLQDALVELAHLPLLTHPEIFQGFMAFKPFTGIELANSLQQLPWR